MKSQVELFQQVDFFSPAACFFFERFVFEMSGFTEDGVSMANSMPDKLFRTEDLFFVFKVQLHWGYPSPSENYAIFLRTSFADHGDQLPNREWKTIDKIKFCASSKI